MLPALQAIGDLLQRVGGSFRPHQLLSAILPSLSSSGPDTAACASELLRSATCASAEDAAALLRIWMQHVAVSAGSNDGGDNDVASRSPVFRSKVCPVVSRSTGSF